MKKYKINPDNLDSFYKDNYNDCLNVCIRSMIENKTKDIEKVTDELNHTLTNQFKELSLNDCEEYIDELTMDIRGELVALYNLWFDMIEKEISEYNKN